MVLPGPAYSLIDRRLHTQSIKVRKMPGSAEINAEFADRKGRDLTES
jgi:hypothetical protein